MSISIELTSTKPINFKILRQISNIEFYSLTWHIEPLNKRSYFTNDTYIPVLELAKYCQEQYKRVFLHIPCQNLTKYEALTILDRVKLMNIKNIVTIRGDIRHASCKNPYFTNTLEFIEFIKRYYGDFFEIGVAGYPRGHPLSDSIENDLDFLKAKIDSGAEIIFTQFEYEYETIEKFILKCRTRGIRVPITIGIYFINALSVKIAPKCGVIIPSAILKIFNDIKWNPLAIDNYSTYQAIILIKQLLVTNNLNINGIHIYSANNLLKIYYIFKNMSIF